MNISDSIAVLEKMLDVDNLIFSKREAIKKAIEILKEIEWYELQKENKKLKERLSIAEPLVQKGKELITLYQLQIERYERALNLNGGKE